jgi:serine/threonine-protein kinase
MDDRKNERFGRYEILSELGRGAMGIVYKARDPKINRVVAVKTISLAGQPPEDELEYRERFLREAEAAGQLSHPGIVTIFDVGEEPETRAPYIVMEFVAGQSLDKLLLSRSDRKLPAETAVQIALELAEALDCAHGQGVVHRDLKPANILVAEDGHVKIADFGIAKLNLANATMAGRSLGTPAYMSPEQLNGGDVDGRSDLFSLGVVLYTILTGYRPFQGNSAMTVAFKVVNREPIPATILDTELPPGLDYIISRAIAKDPSVRYQRGMEMALDLQELQQGREPWSKAKQPGTPAISGAGMNETGRSSHSLTARTLRLPDQRAPKRQASPAEALMEAMRSRLLLAATLLSIGLLIFGLRMRTVIMPADHPGLLRQAETSEPSSPPAPASAPVESPTAVAAPAPVPDTTRKPGHISTTHITVVKANHSSVRAAGPAAAPAVARAALPAMLEIEVEHKFTVAKLSIWVDDRLAYEHPLEGTDKKRLAVFHHVEGHEFHAVQIAAGKHLLRVEVTSDANPSQQSGTVEGEFLSGTEKSLRILFSKRGEMSLSLQ